MLFFRRRIRHLLDAAHAAARKGDWSAAVRNYRAILERTPDRADIRVQCAHALKEQGRYDEAAREYRRAAVDADDDPDAPFHLGQMLLAGSATDDALAALSMALERNPAHREAFDVLEGAHLLSRLEPGLLARVRAGQVAALAELEESVRRQAMRAQAVSRRYLGEYDTLRPAMSIAAPAQPLPTVTLCVVIDAREAIPAFLHMTLHSLRNSAYAKWQAYVMATPELAAHPIASLADLDPRIAFFTDEPLIDAGAAGQIEVHLSAGCSLDAQALGWLAYTFESTAAEAAVSDWDSCTQSWDGALRFSEPHLHGVFDLDRAAVQPFPPPMLAIRADLAHALQLPFAAFGPVERRAALIRLGLERRAVAHVPLPLISIGRVSVRAEIAPENGEPAPVWCLPPEGCAVAPGALEGGQLIVSARADRPALVCGPVHDPDASIRVIIPTRDCADMLRVAISSLLESATSPDRVFFTIVDNRSQEAETAAFLDELRQQRNCTVIAYDRPFNWSAINNLAAEDAAEDILVFANNDIQMLGQGWDQRLRGQLQRSDIGVVGARLLYPDGQIQHAGMLFGLLEGAPVHDGVAMEVPDAERDARFDHGHACAAVTGAFMAIGAATFRAIGGFDAIGFAIAYNDVDLCLAVRARGLKVLYDPGIELIHFESRTRGLNNNRAKVAWDQEELRTLRRKWGDDMLRDPGVSPWWAKDAIYAAYRNAGISEITAHIARSARCDPWVVV